jgi:hypothetical protein
MISYLKIFVVEKSQHRPELFWFVTGPVLKSISVLNTCTSAICADLACKADLMSEWDKMVRASCSLGSDDVADSQEAMLDSVRLPSTDLGLEMRNEDRSEDNVSINERFSSSTVCMGIVVSGLDREEPILYGVNGKVKGYERTCF